MAPMIVFERNRPTAASYVDSSQFAEHLRIEDAQIFTAMAYADAAALEIERYANIALLTQEIVATIRPDASPVSTLQAELYQVPLIGPVDVATIPTVVTVAANGTTTPMLTGWTWQAGPYPSITFDTVPTDTVRINYFAGYGPTHGSVPADLRHAVMDQALRLYDRRGDVDAPATLAPSAARISVRYRRVTL